MTIKNVSASVRQRLLNLARAHGVDFNQLLIRHAIERLLFRLTTSSHADSFVLKGAMAFAVWGGSPHRPTQDLDLLGFGDPSADRLTRVFRDICRVNVESDGWVFDPASVTAEPIRTTDDYGGMRIHLTGKLGSATVRVQTDIGFGDAITPRAMDADYPVLIQQAVPRLKVYPAQTVVAEKIEAITRLGMLNTRFKDYYDLKFLAEKFDFEGEDIISAIEATFTRRGSQIPADIPTGLSAEFAHDPVKNRQWTAFARRLADSTTTLPQVVTCVATFLKDPLQRTHLKQPFPFRWKSPGPWKKA